MVEIEYTVEFSKESGKAYMRSSSETVTLTVDSNTLNPKREAWNEFINRNSLNPVTAYNKWEITNEQSEFKNPPWDTTVELKHELLKLAPITSVKQIHSRSNHIVLRIQVDKQLPKSTIQETINNYFEGLDVKSNYPGTNLVIASPKRHLSI